MAMNLDSYPDYDLRSVRKRARRRGRETIDVERARRLYDRLGSWRAVSEFVRRRDGSAFNPQSIFAAVRWVNLTLVTSDIAVEERNRKTEE